MEYPSLDKATKGAIRFNTDTSQLEIYDGNQWTGVLSTSGELDTGGGRGIIAGGYTGPGSSGSTNIDYFNIQGKGSGIDFGNLTDGRWGIATGSSRNRGLFAGGDTPGAVNTVEYITIPSTGDAVDYGDLTAAHVYMGGLSNETRMLACGGSTPTYAADIDYTNIATTGNFIDSGFDILAAAMMFTESACSPTRGVLTSGTAPAKCQYVSILSMGNAAEFGTLSAAADTHSGICSNSTRGLVTVNIDGQTNSNVIEYITIASLGNATDFGDLNQNWSTYGTCASKTRGVWAGGRTYPAEANVHMSYANISSLGNANDFGDLQSGNGRANCGLSNDHGGLP